MIERCGEDGIQCGDEGCCTAGNLCSKFGKCIPDKACTVTEDCSADSQCIANRCQPWDILPDGSRFSSSCRANVDLPTVLPTVQCSWPGQTLPAEFPESVQVIGTPMVVDFNSDGDPATIHPSIVFISYDNQFADSNGVLRVIDGKDCSLQATIQGEFPFTPEVPVALGDINGDGRPDIVAADRQQLQAGAATSGIAAFEVSGTGVSPSFRPIGRVRSSGTGIIKGFALHDIDNDQYPEIFTEKTMLRFDPVQGLITNVSALQQLNRPELTAFEPPTVIDLDGDRQSEVITPQGIFTWDTLANVFVDKKVTVGGNQALWDNADDFPGAFMAMANLGTWPSGLPDGVDSAEMVVIGPRGEIQVKTVNGTTRFRMETAGLAGGPPVIADVDGDGRMEFASGGLDKVTVFDLDCTPAFFNKAGCEDGQGEERANGVLWEGRTQGGRSGVAVFDFDGDGKTEVVYSDQCFMRVYDGRSGEVVFSAPRSSTTQWEYPVVVDSDGDTQSEIITSSNDNDPTVVCPATDPQNQRATVRFAPTHGITVWKELQDRWAGSRPVWNQHNYFVVNVNDDGTIPPQNEVKMQWKDGGPNSFRQQVQGATGRSLSLADVTTAGLASFECSALGQATLSVDLCNRGLNTLPADGTEVALVDPRRPTTVLCTQRNERAIPSGACNTLQCNIPVTPGGDPFNVQILGDPGSEVEECVESNNVSIISRVSCGPTGPQ